MGQIKNTLIRADESLFFKIYGPQDSRGNKLFALVTNLGGVTSQVLLILLLTSIPATRPIGLRLGYIQIIVTAIIQAIKKLTSRTRPYDAHDHIVPLKRERDYSFPSGHTAAAFSCSFALYSLTLVALTPVLAVALLIGYSRVRLGMHYPSDVIAGGVLGILLTFLLLLI